MPGGNGAAHFELAGAKIFLRVLLDRKLLSTIFFHSNAAALPPLF